MSDYHELAQNLSPYITPWVSSSQGYGLASRVLRTTNQSIPNNALTAITFDTERRDAGGFWVVGNPTRLTVPVDGFYLFGATIVFDANATGVRGVYFQANGTTLYAGDERNAGATAARGTAISPSTAVNLAAGTYVEVSVFQNSGGALNALFLSAYSPEFWIVKVG